MKIFTEKVTAYRATIWMTFVDFRKAFGTVEFWDAIWVIREQELIKDTLTKDI